MLRFAANIEGIRPRTWQVRCDWNYPANVKIIRVPCTGKVDVIHLLRAIQKGADGVYLVGCLEGSLSLQRGQFPGAANVSNMSGCCSRRSGIEGDRVRMYNLSSGEGPTFAAYAKEMTEHIRQSWGPTHSNDNGKHVTKGANNYV